MESMLLAVGLCVGIMPGNINPTTLGWVQVGVRLEQHNELAKGKGVRGNIRSRVRMM